LRKAGSFSQSGDKQYKISSFTYVAPFGRYVGSSQVSPRADEVLVGRAGHRAYFIDLLISAGRRGAFLVTGRRGAGKTSFVQHCIAEYEASVFKRFLWNNVGRAFWDRVLVLLFWMVVLLAGLLLSETAELLAGVRRGGPHGILLWVVLLPIGVALLFPCVYARAAIEVVLDTLPSAKRSNRPEGARTNSVLATFAVLLAVTVAWYLPGLSSPAWTAGVLLNFLAALYLGTQALSFVLPHQGAGPRGSIASKRPIRGRWANLVLVTIPALMSLYPLTFPRSEFLSAGAADSLETILIFPGALAVNLFAALCMLSGGLFLRGWYQRRAAVRLFKAQQDETSDDGRRSPIRSAFRRGGMNYIIPGCLLFLTACWLEFISGAYPSSWLIPLGTLGMVGVGMFSVRPLGGGEGNPRAVFLPRPRLILLAGALVSLVISVQLAQPILQPVFRWTVDPTVQAVTKLAGPLLRYLPIGHEAQQPFIDHLEATLVELPSSLAGVPGVIGDAGEDATKGWAVFWYRNENLLWLCLILVVAAMLHFIQYEWIIRPYTTPREDGPLDAFGHTPWNDVDFLNGAPERNWRDHRKVAELTLPWTIYRVWLPTAAISVNLGFDSKLGAGQVVQAMLVGLREAYQRTFTSWSSWQANIRRIGAILALIVLTTLVGDAWFRLPGADDMARWIAKTPATGTAPAPRVPASSAELSDGEGGRRATSSALLSKPDSRSACDLLAQTQQARRILVPDLICLIGSGWFDLVYLDLIPQEVAHTSSTKGVHPQHPESAPGERLLLYSFLPYRNRVTAPQTLSASDERVAFYSRWSELFPPGLYLNTYHIIIFLTLLLIFRTTRRRVPVIPFQRNLRRIDDLLDSMSSRTRIRRGAPVWEPARWIYSLVTESVREMEREPLDPRTVELAFLQILDDIQRGGLRMTGVARNHLNVPAPEITFVFDELDKLGTRLDPEEDHAVSTLATELRAVQADQERALKLRGLLSDLKNILSSAPARFIFIGGRNLHDEWLADQTARQPLLTNIFIAEVYLPSLLTDRSRKYRASTHLDGEGRSSQLHTRIDEFALYQFQRATELYRELILKDFRPSFALRAEALVSERFASQNPTQSLEDVLRLYPSHEQVVLVELPEPERRALVDDFVGFLTLRSMGNPKRLKELLASFIRPLSQEVGPPDRWKLACRHVLRFRDVEIFRVQLIASIYRHLSGGLEERMVGRDDKTAISVFFLSDFIFKFHRRAFSWSNLERVDELAHIHRAPDLRDVQEEMVNLFSERFLHRVLNGMYSFRFRSDVAREVEFLSRISPAEMAALNFTLDESQTLKAIYHDSLAQRERKGGPSSTLVAGLGELYEFDQEYESARHYYQRSIEILDEKLCNKTGNTRSVRHLLRGRRDGMEDARVFLPWGEARLRLMLQIGMTFEITRNLEHAVTEYRSARTLARAMVKACLALDAGADQQTEDLPTGRFHTLKHLNILFQPIFAEAWASEKITSTVETSNQLIEAGLWEIRRILPFVKDPKVKEARNPAEPTHANLALTMSQLHNKAGDLYFFKGRQRVLWSQMVDRNLWSEKETTLPAGDGYLLRAHYHYAVSLHEVRRYACHRVRSSRYRLGLGTDRSDTVRTQDLPDFLCRAVASSVSDMAEATLGRVSLFGVARSLGRKERARGKVVQGLEEEVLEWLGLDDEQASAKHLIAARIGEDAKTSLGDRANWLGRWKLRRDYDNAAVPLIKFDKPDGAVPRFLLAIKLCRAGAQIFRRGGYIEDAARELLQVCWIVTRMLWWIRTLVVLRSWGRAGGEKSPEAARATMEPWLQELFNLDQAVFQNLGDSFWVDDLLRYLAEFAVGVLQEADGLFQQCRYRLRCSGTGQSRSDPKQFLGKILPPEIMTLACGLSFFLQMVGKEKPGTWSAPLNDKLLTLVSERSHSEVEEIGPWVLHDALKCCRYPLLNRLNGLQLLVDDLVLNRWADVGVTERNRGFAFLGELLELSRQYAAPHHFTPQQSGTTCALFWLQWKRSGEPANHEEQLFLDRVYRTAQIDLRTSEEMFTLNRAYYESISDLFYLYDDFNDRHVHFKNALQMASAELTAVLRHLLEVASAPSNRK